MSTTSLRRLEAEGTGPPAEIIRRLLDRHRLRVTGDLHRALDPASGFDFFVWKGEYPGDDAGRYWIPALFDCRRLPEALRSIQTDHPKHKGCTHDQALALLSRWHTGLGKRFVALCPWAFVEIDHLPRAEQEARYEALTVATRLRWAMWVFTGGKSVHAYLAFTRPLAPDDPLRLEIQRLLVVILEGDTRIVDPGRLMRLPGWVGPRRGQPVVHFDDEATYDPEDVRDRLRGYASSLGLVDVDTAYATLQLAERVASAAARDFGDSAVEKTGHAAMLRATRAAPDTQDLEVGRLMMGGSGSTADSIVLGNTSTFEVAESLHDEWAGLAPGRHDHCPWCGSRSLRVLSVVSKGTGLAATCFKEGTIRYSEWAAERMTERVDLDTLVDELVAGANGAAADDDDDESDISEADRHVEALEQAAGPFAPVVPDDLLADILGSVTERDVRASLCRAFLRLARTPDQTEDEEAEARFEQLGGHAVWCPRGPNQHETTSDDEGRSSRLACNAYRCYVCGPRQVYALRAAARTVLRREAAGWNAVRFSLDDPGAALQRALRRWSSADPEHRAPRCRRCTRKWPAASSRSAWMSRSTRTAGPGRRRRDGGCGTRASPFGR